MALLVYILVLTTVLGVLSVLVAAIHGADRSHREWYDSRKHGD